MSNAFTFRIYLRSGWQMMFKQRGHCEVWSVGWILMQLVHIFAGIMARNASSRGSIRGNCTNPLAQGLGSAKHKVAPAPPQLPDDARPSTPTVDNNNQPKTGVTWPSGSIPRRVKKLSWDDESCQQRKVSVRTLLHTLMSCYKSSMYNSLQICTSAWWCSFKRYGLHSHPLRH
jgi:hypothetical protein